MSDEEEVTVSRHRRGRGDHVQDYAWDDYTSTIAKETITATNNIYSSQPLDHYITNNTSDTRKDTKKLCTASYPSLFSMSRVRP